MVSRMTYDVLRVMLKPAISDRCIVDELWLLRAGLRRLVVVLRRVSCESWLSGRGIWRVAV